MNLPETFVAENLDEIIRRSDLRLEQERIHVGELDVASSQRASAKTTLDNSMRALQKLKAYRAKFD